MRLSCRLTRLIRRRFSGVSRALVRQFIEEDEVRVMQGYVDPCHGPGRLVPRSQASEESLDSKQP
jgi:hypothetical protein